MLIYINSKIVAPVITGIISLFGTGIAVNELKKRKGKKHSYNQDSSVGSKITEAVNDSIYEASGQGEAAVVDVVNAIRIDGLLKRLEAIDRNKTGADNEIRQLKAEVQKLLKTNRGGIKGIHGFLGETSQVHVSNIKAFINGDEPLYILLDDNSMTDYTRGMEIIQQKACQAGGHLGLDAIRRHKTKYPEFVEKGGIYQIPRDMFERYRYLKNLPENVAGKLRKEDLRLWKYIQSFTEKNPDVNIEPMEVSYSDIQAGNIENTVKRTEDYADKEFKRQCQMAHEEYAPTFEEFLKICSLSAAIEGGVNAGIEFVQKLKRGKKLRDFTRQDAEDIFGKFAVGCGKGSIRGGFVYVATNVYKIPATVVSAVITAMFGIAHEGYLYYKKRISNEQFMKNSLFIAFETAASAGGAAFGKHIFKKHPIIGAVAGSILGSAGIGSLRKTVFA